MSGSKTADAILGNNSDKAGANASEFFGFDNSGYRDADPRLFSGDGSVFMSPSTTSPDKQVSRGRDSAVANTRHVDRNNPLVHGSINKHAASITGANLRLQSQPNWRGIMRAAPRMTASYAEGLAKDLAEQFEAEWQIWANDPRCTSDARRHFQFGGNMQLAVRNAVGAEGEVAIIMRYNENRRDAYNARHATFLEVINPQRIKTPPDMGGQEGKTIRRGRKVDPWGAYTGFYVETEEEHEPGKKRFEYVPRENDWGRPIGIHWFFKNHAGLQRSMPALISSLRDVKMFETLEDSELQERIIASLLSIYVETDKASDEVLRMLQRAPTGEKADYSEFMGMKFGFYEDMELDANGKRIPVFPPGDQLKMASIERSSDGGGGLRDSFNQKMSALSGMSVQEFTGDYGDVNYSGIRQALLDTWRIVTAKRHLFTQATGALSFMAFADELMVNELVKLPAQAPDFWENMSAYCNCTFMGPGMGWIDPLKEAKAARERIDMGLSDPIHESAIQGTDYFENIDRRRRAEEYAEERGVELNQMEMKKIEAASMPDSGAGRDGDGDGERGEGKKKKKDDPDIDDTNEEDSDDE